MCGPCAFIEHPEDYKTKVAGQGGTWMNDRFVDMHASQKPVNKRELIPQVTVK